MNWKFEKTAVITGAASGLGRALAVKLANEGFKIGVVDINRDEAEKTLEMIKNAGSSGEVFLCDVTNLNEIESMADHFFNAWGKIGMLVNNAGVMCAGLTGDTPIEEWKRIIDINLWGVIYGCHVFVPRMKNQGAGQIVNIASIAGIIPPIEQASYNVSKAGVIGLSETLRLELAPFNIGVSAVCPLSVKTNILKDLREDDKYLKSLWGAAFANQKLTPEKYAGRVVKAVKKNRLYIMSHVMGKIFWLNKRLAPFTLTRVLTYLSRKNRIRPFFIFLARRGWM